ncbi:MAG: ABC transporter permease [Anaerolineae bacterium]
MDWRNIWNLVWKEWLEFRRDMLLVLFVVLAPVAEMTTLAYATSGGMEHVPTAVYDQDHSHASRDLVMALRTSQCFDVTAYVDNWQGTNRLLDTGTVRAALLIPTQFAGNLASHGQPARALLLLDGTEANTAAVAQTCSAGIANAFTVRRIAGQMGSGIGPWQRLQARIRVRFNPALRNENFYIPAELGAILSVLALVLTAVAVSKERERGTLEQLLVTPIRSRELIIGKAVPAMLITYIDFIGMLAAALFWFKVPIHGSLLLLMVLSMFFVAVETGWGLLISTMSRTQGQALVIAFFFIAVETVLSGYMIAPEYMPTATRWISMAFPLRYFIVISRGIFLKGTTLTDLWPELMGLVVLGLFLFTFSASRLRQSLD